MPAPMDERYICIHAHFYQPPRENPWLEAIEQQDSAYPYHDWNERITAECYEPNALSRILDAEGQIVRIVNNYSRISFNFGPTLLSWMEEKAPEVYEAVLTADRKSMTLFSGHGSAMAQAYNHMIMPLANQRDKYTQALWGVRDFQHRYGRDPEGMWLPETAVDIPTLEVLADLGIKFTVLAPRQAKRFRRIGEWEFKDTPHENIDPTTPYRVNLPSGKSIGVFFYDGPISRAVAFEQLLRDGRVFVDRLLGGFHDQRPWPQLMHVATDGETYGHHHRFGDMALAFALHHIESTGVVKLTNYGEFLEKYPPEHEVEIVEDSSWSCVHGVERWRSDCGCNSGGRAGWNQAWRGGLRQSLDWLRDELAPRFHARAKDLLKDPWRARDQYVSVVLDRSAENLDRFFAEQATHPLSEEEMVVALKLLELERHAMLMYTSCGWFFDELSGIETTQVIMYAGRAIQVAQELFGNHTEAEFLKRIAAAKSNLHEQGDGARIYERYVKPAMVDLQKVTAHYAISSLFEEQGPRVYCYEVEREDYQVLEAGRSKLALGKQRVRSVITLESALLTFAVLYMGEHNLSAAVRPFQSREAFEAMAQKAMAAFERADLAEVIRLMDKEFEGIHYSLSSLFRDQQRKIIHRILESIYEQAEASYRQVYDQHAPIMRFMGELNMPLPRVFEITAEFVLNAGLRRAFRDDDPDLDRISTLLHTAQREQVKLDYEGLAFTLTKTLGRLMTEFAESPSDMERLRKLVELIKLGRTMPSEVNLWRVQNIYYRLLQTVYPEYRSRTDDEAQEWLQKFTELGRQLRVRVETAPGTTEPIAVA